MAVTKVRKAIARLWSRFCDPGGNVLPCPSSSSIGSAIQDFAVDGEIPLDFFPAREYAMPARYWREASELVRV